MLPFLINIRPGQPVYEQIIAAVKRAVAHGQLQPGDRFPSVRELSKELRINPNTAQKAISHLVRDEILLMKPGIGSIIGTSETPRPEEVEHVLNEKLEFLVVEAKRLHCSKEEVIAAVERHWEDKEK
jgi:GntR family transcriptional regulator